VKDPDTLTGIALVTTSDAVCAEVDRAYAEATKVYDEATRVHAEADKVRAKAGQHLAAAAMDHVLRGTPRTRHGEDDRVTADLWAAFGAAMARWDRAGDAVERAVAKYEALTAQVEAARDAYHAALKENE